MSETAALSGAASGLISAGSDIAGGISNARAMKSQGAYERQISEFNARLADMQAKEAVSRGDKSVVAIRKQKKQVQGAQRAALAAQGLDLSSGSAADVVADTEMLAEEDVIETRANAWREAFGFRVQAMNYRHSGAMAELTARSNAKQTLIASGISAGRKIMETGTKLANRYVDEKPKKEKGNEPFYAGRYGRK